jgi:NAD(P)-dependent dehydrogenase (short-subunit alcohol dehydrogenase family)
VLASASDAFHVILACRSLEKAKAAVSEIEAAGIKGSLSVLQMDTTDEVSVRKAAADVERQFGRLDVLVNNAAVGALDCEDTKTRFHLCLETNVIGPAVVSEAFRSLLFKSQNPYSIYVSSGLGSLVRNAAERMAKQTKIGNGESYVVSKAALNMLVVLEAGQYGPKGLKVFAMSPGFVRSNLRGQSEEARSGWGGAGDAKVAGELLLSIVEGKRDGDVTHLVHKDGRYEW